MHDPAGISSAFHRKLGARLIHGKTETTRARGGLDRSTMSTLVFVNIMQPKCIRLHFAFLLFVTRATCDFHPSLPVHTIPAEDHNSEHVEGFFIDCPQTRVSWEFFYFSLFHTQFEKLLNK